MRNFGNRLQRRVVKVLIPVMLLARTGAPLGHAATTRDAGPTAERSLRFEVALTANAITQSNTTVGMADSNLYGETAAQINESLDKMKSLGVTSVRILIPWAFVEPLPGVYDWSKVDLIVDAAQARGISVLGDITSASPFWSAQPG